MKCSFPWTEGRCKSFVFILQLLKASMTFWWWGKSMWYVHFINFDMKWLIHVKLQFQNYSLSRKILIEVSNDTKYRNKEYPTHCNELQYADSWYYSTLHCTDISWLISVQCRTTASCTCIYLSIYIYLPFPGHLFIC